MNTETSNNIAYIDAQNLHLGTTKSAPRWTVDLAKFRVYLEEKYHVKRAYYHMGCVQNGERAEELYEYIQASGFILHFRQHNIAMLSKKKGNVDSDIIFSAMKRVYKNEDFDKIVLVSGDGDYKALVDFLIEEKRFKKLLFPNKKYASSLYKELGSEYFDHLENPGVRRKIE